MLYGIAGPLPFQTFIIISYVISQVQHKLETVSEIKGPAPKLQVIPDFRAPDNVRLGITPLYTSFTDIHRAMDHIRLIVAEKVYLKYSEQRLPVT